MGIVEHCPHLSTARSEEDCRNFTFFVMLKFVVASCIAATACGQLASPKDAKILKEQRFNAGDGRFGSAFAQEDGTVYREETTADGERVGQYSYIDNDGKTITVRYTAGKDGFRILEGAHVPTGANGQSSAPFVATPAPAPAAPRQVAAPVQVSAPVRQVAAPVPQQPLDYDYFDNEPADPNFNPFINPHDPTHRDFRFNQNGATFAPQRQQAAPSASLVPNCANCAGVNPFINPFDASHQQPQQFITPTAAPFRQFQPQPQRVAAPVQPVQPAFNLQPATEAPRRFFPPGQLNLNRFETGFNFDFSSQK